MPNPSSKKKTERGSIVLVPFPNSDLRTAKLRPAIIVQIDDLNTDLNQVVVAMVSSNLKRNNHKSRVLIETKTELGKNSGLIFDSVIMTDNIATILLTSIIRVVGKIEDMSEIDDALRHTLGLD